MLFSFVNSSPLKLVAAASTAAIALSAAPAQAASFTTSADFSGSLNQTQNVQLSSFNPNLGKLNSVTGSFQGTADNNLPNFRVSAQTAFAAVVPPVPAFGFSALVNIGGPNPPPQDFFAAASSPVTPISFNLLGDRFQSPPQNLIGFIGTGSFNVILGAFDASPNTNNISNFASAQSVPSSASNPVNYTFTLAYDYTPTIPTPMLLPGLIGMGLAALRRQQRCKTIDPVV